MRTLVVALSVVLTPALALAQPVRAVTPLAGLIAELETANPELAAVRRDVDASIARIGPAGAPPDPTLSAGYVSGFLRPPFYPAASTPDGRWEFGVTQEFPYPGKLASQAAVATREAEQKRWAVEVTRVDLVAALKTAYADLELADRSLGILERTRVVLDQAREHAETRFRVGRGPQQDVLRAQLEVSMLLERMTTVRRNRTAALSAINGIVGRAPDTAVIPAPLTVDSVPPLAELERLARVVNPRVRRDEQTVMAGEAALTLARRQVLPDFGVTVTTERKTGGMPWMYGVDVMATVPVFWQRKQRPLVAEATARLGAARLARETTSVQTGATLAVASADERAARELLTLYRDSILPQARLTLEASLASYQTGSVDFLTLFSNITSVLNAELSYAQQQAELARAVARIEPLTGLSLVR